MRRGEPGIRRTIRNQHEETIAFHERALVLCHALHTELCKKLVPASRERAKAVAVGLWTKMCKQFRAILVLSELGLVEDAEVACRTFFECVLQTLFVVKRNVILKRGWSKAPKPPRGGFAMEFRAEIYLARSVLDDRKRVNVWKRTPGCKRVAKKIAAAVDEMASWCEGHVGKRWMNWLQDGKQSGDAFRVERMAENLGLGRWYASVYRLQSSIVHAGDATRHMDADDEQMAVDVRLGPDVESAAKPLQLAIALMGRALEVTNARFQLGLEKTIREMAAEWRTILAKT